MNKLEQAARQALEALEWWDKDGAYRPFVFKRREAITALQEALAEPQVDWKEEALRLGGLNAKHVGELRKLETEQAEQEPVAWRDDFERCRVQHVESFCHSHKVFQMMQKYAAPVRTKDLTDDDIFKTNKTELPDCQDLVDFARAVIAADREKNK